ncbi:chorismate--pyruvate lyase [Aggregatibacter aphrophilus NJ8700]|jgi:hypothetical protein|uniref:chorismate--pyruvate lyase family protein n=1 Tax=Aggregatibacter aphrophilus TaxID=732 RepID=UPI0001AAE5B1|nr:chorismate lyase [Aggregatibacter aphrophilus]ACS97775.1 chorismate--pyruvate lyase (CL) (CPL) [Aggregatibacter aphrophilus NJ8700]AKS65098.1 chorismate--pyruvate lyase [Aggregatibacter aphrophilus NJ8700]EHB90267.1 hypothetical protein HMPREF9335_00829 [Aggregatibacter aphrophilus F0387]PNL93009.1 chorismate lyase [Aggregatibacter aphrophilus]RDE89805.1 chorismate lyase [Aggregatibacter aphrophilus]
MPNSIFPRLQWHEEQVLQTTQIPLTVQSWLFEKGSLTARLKQVCQQFDVKVQSEKWIEKIFENETALLPNKPYWCREVLLYGDNSQWVAARTLISYELLKSHQNLLQLGTKPIGEWLFTQALQRQKIQWAFDYQTQYYARRSLIFIQQVPLLISEIFLEQSLFSEIN